MRRIAICGGGHLGHTLAAVIGATGEFDVRVLTRDAASWRPWIRLTFGEYELSGAVRGASTDPALVIPGAEAVLLAVPAYARANLLASIVPYLERDAWVGAVPGAAAFDADARAALPEHARVFGTARTPYICRTLVGGAEVEVTGVSPELRVATLPGGDVHLAARLLEALLAIPTVSLSSYDAVNLTPSNPLVHSCRLYTLFGQQNSFATPPRFYADWDDHASEVLLECDDELARVRAARGISDEEVPPVRVHYGVDSEPALTRRFRGLTPLRRIAAPVRENGAGWIADVAHRYFTEDLGMALPAVQSLAREAGVATPSVDAVVAWGRGQLAAR